MKKIITVLVFIALVVTVHSQGLYLDVVYLKNGSAIRGMILEQVPNQTLKIQTPDGNVFFYGYEEVEKLTREPQTKGPESTFFPGSTSLGQYVGIVEGGYLFGLGNNPMDRMQLDIINGFRINPYFSLGFGTGLRYYVDVESPVIPVFADFRVRQLNRKFSPYFSLGMGYAFDVSGLFPGMDFLVIPSTGFNYKISDKSGINLGIKYEMQDMNVFINEDCMGSENSGALGFSVGISF